MKALDRGVVAAALGLVLTAVITLTGILSGEEINFTSRVEVQGANVGNMGGNGVFGGGITPRFVVRRVQSLGPAPVSNVRGVGAARGARFGRGQPAVVVPPLVPGGIPVTGRIVVDQGRPRPVFQLAFSDATGAWIAVASDPTGRGTFDPARASGVLVPANPPVFTIDLPPGEYRPIVSGLPPGYVVRSIESGSVDLRAQLLKVAAGGPPPQFTLTLGVTSGSPWVKVRGRLVNIVSSSRAAAELKSAQLPGPISIMLISPSFSEHFAVPLAADGSFEFPSVLPGAYTVRVPPNIPVSPTSIVVGDKDLLNLEIHAAP